MTFTRGQRVQTPKGPGTVVYQRLNPITLADASAVSVVLDSCRGDDQGTIFLAQLVTPLKVAS